MDNTPHNVFISYSREDRTWVSAMVNLLIAGGARVFMDVRDIAYGDDWQDVLMDKLREVERVLVFWSMHAARSPWVEEECRIAIGNGKRLVPVPIDGTPLPASLAKYHALTDLVPLLQQSMNNAAVPQPPPFPDDAVSAPAPAATTAEKSSSPLRVVAIAAAIALLAAPLAFFVFTGEPPEAPTATLPPGSGMPLPPHQAQASPFPWAWVVVGVPVLAVATWLVIRRFRRRLVRNRVHDVFNDAMYSDRAAMRLPQVHPEIHNAILGMQVVEMVFREPEDDASRREQPG